MQAGARNVKVVANCKARMNQPPGDDWLVLLPCGLDAVEAVLSSGDGSHERIVSSVLEGVGLAPFLAKVWLWQDVDVCKAFILHWNHTNKTTRVFGLEVDAGYPNFVALMGIQKRQELPSNFRGERRIVAKDKRVVEFVKDMESRPVSYLVVKNPVIESVLLLLHKTLWLTKKPNPCPTRDMVYLLFESLRGEPMASDWSRCAYERFIGEMRKLQDRHENNPSEQLRTLAGPLMSFLYLVTRSNAQVVETMRGRSEENEKHRQSFARSLWSERSVLKERNQYQDEGDILPPGFRSGSLKLPFPPRFLQSTIAMNLLPRPGVPDKTLQEVYAEVEEKFSKTIAAGWNRRYQVSEEVMRKLTRAYEEQKHRQEAFKLQLRSFYDHI